HKSYIFKELCDVKGNFSANFQKDFSLKFEMRNLQDFSNTEMTVRMKVNTLPSGIRYGFEVLEGLISAPTRNAHFKADYTVEINPTNGKVDKNSQAGKVTLTKVGSKEVNVSAPLRFDD
ncbi:MAG: hypothetical protein H0V66_01880, partial [Bdellovibrionales bacterium]|nr:hypothetical protein [Bdellovibrionales bacterium]